MMTEKQAVDEIVHPQLGNMFAEIEVVDLDDLVDFYQELVTERNQVAQERDKLEDRLDLLNRKMEYIWELRQQAGDIPF
jgi:hypothetical protein